MQRRLTPGERLALFPRLTFFYGLSPQELAATPNLILDHYINALPALISERKLQDIDVSSYPHLTAEGRERTMDRIGRELTLNPAEEAEVDAEVAQARHRNQAQTLGIKVVRGAKRKAEVPA